MLADGYSPVQQTTRSFNFSQRSLPTGRAATRLVAAAGATIRSQSKTLRHRHAIYFSTTSYPRSCSWLLQSRLRLWSSSWFLQCCLLCATPDRPRPRPRPRARPRPRLPLPLPPLPLPPLPGMFSSCSVPSHAESIFLA